VTIAFSLAPTLLALAVTAAAPGPALVVHAPGDASSEDRVAVRLARALASRMPALRVQVEGAVGPDDLLVTVAPGDDAWSLGVTRRGKQVLERALPVEQGPDAAFVVACALVVERFLQEIDWTGKPEDIDPNAVARPPFPPELPPPPPPGLDWSVGLGASGAVGMFPGQARLGPALDLNVRRDWLLVALRASLYVPTAHSRDVVGIDGSIHALVHEMPTSVAAMGGACFFDQPSVCAGVELGWRGTWAWSSTKELFGDRVGNSQAFLAGAFGSIAIKLPERFWFRALLTAAGFAGDGPFVVEDLNGQATLASPSRFELGLGLEVFRQIP